MLGKNEMLEFELNPGRSRCDMKSRGARERQPLSFRRDFDMRNHVLKMASLLSVALAVALFVPQHAAADDDEDPPSRVARLSYANGTVSFNPGGTDDWVSAVVNMAWVTAVRAARAG